MVTRDSRLRIGVVALVSVALFASLFARLWYLQVMKAGTYNQAARSIATKQVLVPAPRGRILDRNGNVLVGNRSSTVIAVDSQALRQVKDSDAVLSRLAQLINADQPDKPPLTLDTIKARIHSNLVNPLEAVPVAKDVSLALQIYIVEHPDEFPGVEAERQTLRYYPYGSLLAQVLGNVGPIQQAMYEAHKKDPMPYQPNDNVGRAGVEQSFEPYLRGTPGVITYEVDRTGKPVRTASETPPVPGDDVYLTVDVNAQSIVEASLARELQVARGKNCRLGCPPAPAGASVVLDPNNGQVIAMASYPTYDPSLFVPAITQSAYAQLQDPNNYSPILDRAVAGLYYPGSTFKLITALAGLKDGVITPGYVYPDNGSYHIIGCSGANAQSGCVKTNSGREVLGPVDLRLAIAKSSDTYFYRVGDEFWQNGNRQRYGDTPIQDMARAFGFGQKTGIQLPNENAGYVETPASRKQRHDENPSAFPNGGWFSGDNTSLAIGQSTLVTPLQLANAYATFANGGTLYQPNLLLKVTKPFSAQLVTQPQPKVLSHVDIPPQFRDPMLQGFEGATTISGGTATGVFSNYPMNAWPVAGKTGTAQNGADPKTGRERQDTGLFVGFGPAQAPQYVAMAVLEQSGFGADTAAPVVRDFFEPLAQSNGFPVVSPVNTPNGPSPGSAPPGGGAG